MAEPLINVIWKLENVSSTGSFSVLLSMCSTVFKRLCVLFSVSSHRVYVQVLILDLQILVFV